MKINIAAAVAEAIRYRSATTAERAIIDFVDRTRKVVADSLSLSVPDIKQERPGVIDTDREPVGEHFARDDDRLVSVFKITVHGVTAGIEFDIALTKDPTLPVPQHQRWSLDVGNGMVDIGLAETNRFPQPDKAGELIAKALNDAIIAVASRGS